MLLAYNHLLSLVQWICDSTNFHLTFRFATELKEFQHLNPFIAFSGDCLSPSLLSTITKGRHMVDILKELGVHCAVYGTYVKPYMSHNMRNIHKHFHEM